MSIDKIISELNKKLSAFGAVPSDMDLRQKVLLLVEILKQTRNLNKATVAAGGIDAKSARERLKVYMTQYVGIPLDAVELEVVSGISEYGRRIRELRVQDGYTIISGPVDDDEAGIRLKSEQYLLIRPEPDLEAAHRWIIANRIRNEKGSAQDRILKYLKANVGKIVTTEELKYVADINDFQRRVRELRTEEGYAVATRFTGRPDLRGGEYVLEAEERVAEPHDRKIPKDVEREVYARDNNTCRACGWTHDKWTKDDPRFLELHHIQHHKEGGPNSAANLVVACNKCHDEVHAGKLKIAPPE
jgi:hypothetical protein